MSTQEKIIDYIKQKGQVTGAEISRYLGITRQGLFRHLPKLLEAKVITKIGRPPKVFYSINKILPVASQDMGLNKVEKSKINNQFLIITPAGEKVQGLEAFAYWCDKNKLPYKKTAAEYIKTLKKYEYYKKSGLINGKSKMNSTFTNVYLDEIFYLDFYRVHILSLKDFCPVHFFY